MGGAALMGRTGRCCADLVNPLLTLSALPEVWVPPVCNGALTCLCNNPHLRPNPELISTRASERMRGADMGDSGVMRATVAALAVTNGRVGCWS